MKSILEYKENTKCQILEIKGDKRFINRVVSIGITTEGTVQIIQNSKHLPLLLYVKDTMVAISRKDSINIIARRISA